MDSHPPWSIDVRERGMGRTEWRNVNLSLSLCCPRTWGDMGGWGKQVTWHQPSSCKAGMMWWAGLGAVVEGDLGNWISQCMRIILGGTNKDTHEERNEIKSKGDNKNLNLIVFLWDKNIRKRQMGGGLLVPSRLFTHLSPTHNWFFCLVLRD